SYYDEVTTTVRYEGRLRTIQAVREAWLETCVGVILNLGETRVRRVEMALEPTAVTPASLPLNLVTPRRRTKFSDSELAEPAGETPDVVQKLLGEQDAGSAAGNAAPDQESALRVRLWDPSTQLRYRAKRAVPPRPDGSPNSAPAARSRDERGPRREDSALAPAATAAGWGD